MHEWSTFSYLLLSVKNNHISHACYHRSEADSSARAIRLVDRFSWLFYPGFASLKYKYLTLDFFGSRSAGLGRVRDGVFDRWSFGERRAIVNVWSWTFIDILVNFDVYHRLLGRRVCVVSSFTSGVRVRATTTYTPSATISTSHWTAAVQRMGGCRKAL